MQRLVSSDNYNLAMLDFYKKVVPNQKADEAFQANKYTRWSDDQAANYMSSTATGKAPSKFILCDIEKCLKSAIQDERPSDIEYFKNWLAMGVKYLNLDSNNRCINVTNFYKNKVVIESDHYRLGNMIVLVEKGRNDTYDKLPKKLKEAFDNAIVSVQMYTDVTRQELSDIFTRLNDGKPLNEPEKRNASTSLVAQAVRELAIEYYSVFTHKNNKWFTDEQGNRRGPDDEVAKMFYLFVNGHSANVSSVKSLKKMYEIKSKEEEFIRQFKSIFKAFMKWHEDEQVFALQRNSVFDLWIVFLRLKNDENAKIKDGKLKPFLKHYCKIVGNLIDDKTVYDRKDMSTQADFETMIGGKQHGNNIKRHELIWPKIEEVFDTYFVSLDPKRSLNPNEKLSTAARDDFMTPEGKEIDLSKLNDGETYHSGHKDAHVLGNPTTVDNSVIQEAKDNLKLGKNPVKV